MGIVFFTICVKLHIFHFICTEQLVITGLFPIFDCRNLLECQFSSSNKIDWKFLPYRIGETLYHKSEYL